MGSETRPDKNAVAVLGIKALNDPEKMKELLRSLCRRLEVAGGSRRRAEKQVRRAEERSDELRRCCMSSDDRTC